MCSEYFWDTQLDYLRATREKMWNDDYFEFLVKSVWQLDTPKNIVDFGCGYGYLGMKLLPLLPAGSTYTGIDRGKELLCEAERIFANAPYCTEFINSDLNAYTPSKQYDIAICQAVLRHIPQAENILQKMIASVTPKGMVICIEVNRNMEHAGLYRHDQEYGSLEEWAQLKQGWDNELQSGGRDYRLGIKVPIYMQQMGLKNVGVRINDFVNFTSPLSEDTGKRESFTVEARCLIISYGMV